MNVLVFLWPKRIQANFEYCMVKQSIFPYTNNIWSNAQCASWIWAFPRCWCQKKKTSCSVSYSRYFSINVDWKRIYCLRSPAVFSNIWSNAILLLVSHTMRLINMGIFSVLVSKKRVIIWLYVQSHIPDIFWWMLTENEFIVFVYLLYSDSILHQKQNITLIPKTFRSNVGLTAWLSFMVKPMVKQWVFHYTSNIWSNTILLLLFSYNAPHEYGHFLGVGVKKKQTSCSVS